ncbi:protein DETOXIFICATION 55 [Macadamia integrifolia]|uniref:protein DETOXIFICATION 55 n=1 Tax=Macadamia integrifolia TaxID=60698 RepID=UPI001C4F9AD1|nr:protein DETOXIFICATION 55 [Macadamia integrifolia]
MKMVAGDHIQIQKYSTMPEVIEELKRIKDIGLPIAAMGLVGYLKNMISVACMGRLGALELAGGALAIGFTNITGYSVLSGLAMGMEPICSQAFGSRNLPLATLILRRTILILLCASLLIGFLWSNLEPIMLGLQQKPDITRVATIYCQFALPDLIANSFLHPLRIYLRSKGTTWPLMWCTLPAVLLHLPITVFLAFNLRLGVSGVAVATVITNFNSLLFLLCYMFYTSTRTPQEKPLCMPLSPPPSVTAVSMGEKWGTLFRLAIPSCLGVCLEWWWYEFLTVMAGYLGKPRVTLATSAIVIQTTSLMYTLPMALSASVSTRVGNELGAGNPRKARLASHVAMGLSIVASMVGLLWNTIGREAWGRVFTQDDEVLKLTMAVLPIIGLCELGNCPQTTGCGVLRGTARPSIGAAINFYSFYMVGAPVGIFLAIVLKVEFVGLCYGLLAAQIACALSIGTVICKTDWERESLKARDLAGSERGGSSDEDQIASKGEKEEEEEAEFLKEVCVEE